MDTESSCSKSFLATVKYVVCCTTVKKSSRIKVLWGWLFLLATVSAVFLGCVLYRPHVQFAAPSDMRAVTENVRYLFCEMVTIESPGPTFDAFRLEGDLPLSDRKFTFYQEFALYIDSYNYDFVSFYFLPGSKFTVSHCSKSRVVFYVFRGEDNFKTWKNYQGCQECYLQKVYVQISDNCDKPPFKQSTHVHVPSEDQYFIVYSSEDDTVSWVNIEVNLSRTIYDLSNAFVACSDVVSCNVVLEKNIQTAIFQVNSYPDLGMYNHPEFTTSCVPRMWSYFIIYGFGVLIFGIVGTIVLKKCRRTSIDEEHNADRRYERAPLLPDTGPPPSYNSIVNIPPKYEDVMRFAEIDPPSYTEALSVLVEQEAELARSNGSSVNNMPETTEQSRRSPITCPGNSRLDDNRNSEPSETSHSNVPDSFSNTNCTCIDVHLAQTVTALNDTESNSRHNNMSSSSPGRSRGLDNRTENSVTVNIGPGDSRYCINSLNTLLNDSNE